MKRETHERRGGSTRREFLEGSLIAGCAAALGGSFAMAPQDRRIPARFVGDALERGHHWIEPDPAKLQVDKKEKARVVIVGGGFAGICAAWRLAEAGVDDFVVLELEDKAGGLARQGMIGKVAVPFGGGMMAPPDEKTSPAVLRLLEVAHVDRAPASLTPVVFRDGRWSPGDRDAALDPFTVLSGTSRSADSPVADSRRFDEALDGIALAQYLKAADVRPDMETFAARWCLARFGCRPSDVSANAFWKDVGVRFRDDTIRGGPDFRGLTGRGLVVPGGTASLLAPLLAKIGARLLPARVAVLARAAEEGAIVRAVNANDASVTDYEAAAVVLALPPFIAHKIAPALLARDGEFSLPETTPWLVSAFQVSAWPKGFDPGVWFHQATDERAALILHAGTPPDAVIVTQRPFPGRAAMPSRAFLRDLDPAAARDWSLREIAPVLPDLARVATRVELWRVGHGSIRPAPGWLTVTAPRLRAPLPPLYPCGADLGGLPCVESAVQDGVRGAEEVLKSFGSLGKSWL